MQAILKNRKKLILIVSLLIFAGALVYRITHPFKQERVKELTYTGRETRVPVKKEYTQGNQIMKPVPEENLVKLDLLMNPPKHSRKISKNIFTGQKIIDEKPINKTAVKDEIPQKTVPVTVDKKRQVENDLSKFKSFGYLERNGERTLFLERGKQILAIRKGDKIDGKYIVKDITEKELTITALSINEDVHIDLSQL